MSSRFNQLLAAITPLLAAGIAQGQALEEITVTARKTSENLQEVPLAITALTADEIQRLGLKDLDEITQQDTSVQFDEGFTPSDTRVTVRGLSPTRGRPNVATLVDGIDVGSEAVSNPGGSVLVNPRLLDIERIEIVKGPQSALYGRSAFAGAIQYITRDPTEELSATFAVDGNDQEDKEIRGSVSVPLGDSLGMLVNGYAWDNRGYYRNSVTNDYIGGGNGTGVSLTLKWEPGDNFDAKFRAEYTDDESQPIAQIGLNPFNKWVDLGTAGQLGNFPGQNTGPSNLAPNSTNCVTAPGNPGPGPLANPDCLGAEQLNLFFANNTDLGQYNPNEVDDFNQYNRQVINTFVGKIPDADQVRATLNPNYQWGRGAADPANAPDYKGTDKEVARVSLVLNWAARDDLTFNSYTGYTDADVSIQQDIGRFYSDNCTADVDALRTQADPTGTFGSYYDALAAQGITDFGRYAPCNSGLGSDGINDAKGAFTQDDLTETRQFSQELRASWAINESVNLTTGLLYWNEKLTLTDRNATLVTGGTECYSVLGEDASQSAGGQFFTQTDPLQDQCGNTELIAAYWAADVWQARAAEPTVQDRETRHSSWYGSLDWDITEKLRMRAEARYTKEENDVTAPVMTPCLNGAPANDPSDPDSCFTGGRPDRNILGAGGQPTGPSTVVICGQTGRCDRVGVAPVSMSPYYANAVSARGDEFSWWSYGYAPMLSYQASPATRTDRYWTPKLTFEYFSTEDIMTYVSWSRGIKPGGYSLLTIGAFGLDPNLDGVFNEAEFAPERLDVWELGLKSTLFDGRVRLNGALFFQDFKDKQVSLQKVIGNTTGIVTENIDGSEIRGLEVDATWQITENWQVQAGYTFLDSEFTDYTQVANSNSTIGKEALGPNPDSCNQTAVIPGSDPANPRYGCVVSFNGNELERSPRHAVLLNLGYRNGLFDTGLEWYGEVDYRYQDSRFLEQFNIAELQAYSLTNVRFGITADSWDVQLYIDNALDDDTIRAAGPSVGIPNANFAFGLGSPPGLGDPDGILAGPNLPQDIYANLPNPRAIGVRANFRFGT